MVLHQTALPHFGEVFYCDCRVFEAGMRESNSGFNGMGSEVENSQAAAGD